MGYSTGQQVLFVFYAQRGDVYQRNPAIVYLLYWFANRSGRAEDAKLSIQKRAQLLPIPGKRQIAFHVARLTIKSRGVATSRSSQNTIRIIAEITNCR